jgi:hypothetical protein
MSKVIAYKNNDRVCFCQIKFNSREKILVSVASVPEHSIKVIKLLAGIIPYKTIWEFNATKAGGKDPHARLISIFTDKTEAKVNHPLDAIILKLVTCKSCNEAVSALQLAEKAY